MYFCKNGILQGEAFSNLLEGFYHATISLYMGAKVTANFCSEFTFPPSGEDFEWLFEEIRDFKPYSVIANEPKYIIIFNLLLVIEIKGELKILRSYAI